MPTPFETFIYDELPNRPVLVRGTGNPNNSVDPAITNAPQGTLFMQTDALPKKTWQKDVQETNTWILLSAGGNSSALTLSRKFVVTTAFVAAEELTLATGAGATAGASTATGDALDIQSDWATDVNVEVLLNGQVLSKGDQVVMDDTTDTITISIPLDVGDQVVVLAKEVI